MSNLISPHNVFTVSNTVFVFDMQNVFVKIPWWQVFRQFFAFNNKLQLISNLFWYGVNRLTHHDERLLSLEYAVLQKITCIKQQDALIQLIAPDVLMKETVDYIYDLHAQHYTLLICSNMGMRTYAYLAAKYPDLLGNQSPFQGRCLSGSYNNYGTKFIKSLFIECVDLADKIQYERYKRKPEHIIFIDDSRGNVKRARKTEKRFIGFIFTHINCLKKQLKSIVK